MAGARRLAAVVGGLFLCGTALAGCGSSSHHAAPSPSPSASSGDAGGVASGYPSVSTAPGVALTAPGKALQVGETATVAWQPAQHVTGVLGLTVTGLERTSFEQSFKGWELDDATKSNAPYFVTATVRNDGTTDLGGRPVPLYGLAASGALVEASSFATDFKPCQPSVLPTPFPAGASAQVCLVFLIPNGGALDGVSFRPSQAFDPITWSGLVSSLPSPSAAGKSPAGKSPGGKSPSAKSPGAKSPGAKVSP
jgi:hypothetical protein